MVTFLLLFDFSKAFDAISPSRLLVNLKNLGFSGGAIYLRNRTQCVFLGSTTSDYLTTNLRVLQGSVLGPLLFCLNVIDLKHRLKENFILVISNIFYADDFQIYVQVPFDQVSDGLDRLSKAGKYVTAWAHGAGLTINVRKT